MPTNPGFTGLPTPPETMVGVLPWLRRVYDVVTRMLKGGLNIGGEVTLDFGDSTTVNDARISGGSRIVLFPTNEAAALLLQTQRVYVSSKAQGSFVLTHPSATGTETLDYLFTAG